MSAPDQADPLPAALDRLSALGGHQDRTNIDQLRARLAEQRLRVLVAGEAKRGKSTLVNAMLGRPVLPTGVTPLTALATTVTHGGDEQVTAVFADGRTEICPLSALEDLVTERGNPGNVRKLSSVSVSVCAAAARPRHRTGRYSGNRLGLRAQHRRSKSGSADHGCRSVRADLRSARISQRA